VFVDTGLLRLNEGQQVIDTFQKHMGMKLIAIDATARFMDALKGVADPEDKRRIIGREFVHVFAGRGRRSCRTRNGWRRHDLPGRHRIRGSQEQEGDDDQEHHNVGGLPETLQPQAARTVCAISSRTRCGTWGCALELRAR